MHASDASTIGEPVRPAYGVAKSGVNALLGTLEEMAGVIALLLSDDGSFVNGQVWSVNGGFTLRG